MCVVVMYLETGIVTVSPRPLYRKGSFTTGQFHFIGSFSSSLNRFLTHSLGASAWVFDDGIVVGSISVVVGCASLASAAPSAVSSASSRNVLGL